jgi:acyl-CoA thioesterase-1
MKKLPPFAALALAACQGETPAPAPTASEPVAAAAPAPAIPANAPVVLAFGDSLYAGYQLDPGQGYPPRLEAALNAQGLPVRFVNAGVSGDTTAAGLQRLAFTLDNQAVKPALVMVGLGGNDMLRGLPLEETAKNLDAICAELKKRGLPFMLTGLVAAPNLGAEYAGKFNAIYPALAKKYGVPLVPFLLEPVIGKPELILPDHIHPNAQGVEKIVAFTKDDVAKALKTAVK